MGPTHRCLIEVEGLHVLKESFFHIFAETKGLDHVHAVHDCTTKVDIAIYTHNIYIDICR